jgi:hypothetical protein
MKKQVLERAMFAKVSPKSESKGILSGIADDEDEYERRPDDLEIIANNIRGDMRSMDERYLELAQMVGEAAFDTPEEVVTLMQAQFAQQQQPPIPAPAPSQQGIGSLPPQAPPMPPGGIASGMEEQPMLPQGQEPIQMAHGGIVYRQLGSPPSGEMAGRTTIDNELLRQATERRGLLSRMMGGARDLTANIDDRVSNFLSQQMQTRGPVSASGKEIPFVDKQGRFYQPVGGTNPNMPSRGFPMASKFNLGRFATRFGPAGIAAGFATDALIESDPSRGQLYGSMFDLETGAGAEDRPGFARSVVPTSAAPTTVTPAPGAQVEMPSGGGGEGVPPPPAPGAVGGFTKDSLLPKRDGEGLFTRIPPSAEPEDQGKDFRQRVQEKMDIYSEFLGSDPEMRKAQALFMLAEAAVNTAAATGRSTAERIAKGVKGLPAGLAAIGAEAQKDKRAIAAAALSAVEQEYADARKAASLIQREVIRRGTGLSDKVSSLTSSILARDPTMDRNVAIQLARDIDNGTVAQDNATKEWYDRISNTVRWSPYKPLAESQVGYLDERNPYVRVSPETMTVTNDPEARKKLIDERMKLQKNLTMYDRFMSDVYGDTVGVLPTIRSGASRVVLGLFGDIGFGVTDTQLNQIRANQAIGNEYIVKGLFRNSDRVSNLDMKNAQDLSEKPNRLFTDVPLVIGTVQNFQRADLNRLAEIDSQLFGAPMKQLDRIPQGTKTDPLPVVPNTEMLLRDAFTKRPNLSMHLKFSDGKVQRIDSSHPYVQQLLRGTAQ